ncbi:MAG: hypothetical protein R2939_14860 [Kofleriaceae bacterium]
MSSAKGRLLSLVGRLALREAELVAAVDLAPWLRRITLAGAGLRGVTARPGDKVQVLLPSADVRTFTPIGWDAAAGQVELVLFRRDACVAGRWIGALREGERCRFVGPQRSLDLGVDGAVVIVGDETSLAVATAVARAGRDVHAVLEVDDVDGTRAAARALGVEATPVARVGDDGHLGALVDGVRAALASRPTARVALTGRAQTIQRVRRELGASTRGPASVRPYWSTGKVALD